MRRGLMVSLEGFQGPFDSRYPFFDPAAELGGPEGFRALSRAMHESGHRLKCHFNIWGMDPYDDRFAEMEHLAMPYDRAYERIPGGQIGPYDGWPGAYPVVPVGWESGILPVQPVEQGPDHVVFETCAVPDPMEAFLSLYGVRGFPAGTLRALVNGRPVQTRPGAFARSDRTRFPLRFRFRPGVNPVRLDFSAGRPRRPVP